jgi:hypothetical protein
VKQHVFNLDDLDPATVPSAPLGAFDDADWHDVPEGYYLLPVHDWHKFGNDCGPGDETPVLDLLGFRVFVRQVPTLIKTGKRARQTIGRDRFVIGQLVLARGVHDYSFQRRTSDDDPTPVTVRYTPSERLKREVEGDKWSAEHDKRDSGDTTPLCRCADCNSPDGKYREWALAYWKPTPDQANAYANAVAAALIHSVKNENDAFRKLYGQLTGHCGMCGRFIHDPESKRLGLGPDCGNRR